MVAPFTRGGVRDAWRVLAHPVAAFTLHAAALWLWHAPMLYEAAVREPSVHALQHVSFLGTAVLFWWTVAAGRRPARRGVVLLSLFATTLHTGALGAFLALTPRLWYAGYAVTTEPFGLTPLDDQRLAGLVMWVVGSVPYLAAALIIVARMAHASHVSVSRAAVVPPPAVPGARDGRQRAADVARR